MLEITRILEQRRKSLGLTQKDMLMRIGMSQQQYQRIESGGDTRVSTLLRILEGMGLQLRLVPEEEYVMLEITRILEQRRKSLGLTQKDMLMRIGMSQQQYQRIESGGDTRVSTLLRILEGMGLQLRLVPEEQVAEVDALLNGTGRLERNILSEPDESHWDKILKDLED